METSKEVALKIAEITALAILCSENGHHCFVDYSGHVNTIQISLYDGEWSSGKEPIRTGFKPTHSDALDKCESVIYQLKNVLQKKEIDYSFLEEVERIEIDYRF